MHRRCLTQQELARRAHVHPVTLSLALNGRPVFPSTLDKITRALRTVPIDELQLIKTRAEL
jgi:transcriptional regulator with XRE-family HTH domain